MRALPVMLGCALFLAPASSDAQAVDVRSFGAKCDGSADDASAIAFATAQASLRDSALHVSCRLRVASGSTTITAPLVLEGAGAFDVGPGAALTIAGPFSAPLSQVFFERGGTLAFQAKVRDVFPQWWGAKGDGVTDDSTAINKAAAAIRGGGADPGLRLVLPGVNHAAMNNSFRNFYLASSPIDLTDVKNIEFESRIYYEGKSGVAVTVGTASTAANTKSHFIVRGLSVWGSGAATTTGVLVKNATHSELEIIGASSFGTGVVVWADDHNYVAHNTFHVQDVRGCTYGLVLNSAGDGWVNENLFVGGNISATGEARGSIGIWITSARYRHNNNTFLKPCLQAWNAAIQIDHGTSNSFIDVRNEASARTAVFNEDAEYNYVHVLNGKEDTSDIASHNASTNIVTSAVPLVLQPLLVRDFTDAYDDGAFVHVPGFNLRSAGGVDDYRARGGDVAINPDKSLRLSSNVTVGVTVNTRVVRRFMLTVSQPTGARDAIPRITCYDATGRILSGSSPSYVTSSLIPNTLAPSSTVYERSSGRRMKEVRFIAFRPEVASAYVGIAGTDAVWGYNIYAIGDLERQSAGYALPYAAHLPVEVWGVPQGSSVPTSCGWPIGARVFNVDPATIATTSSWTCVARAETTLSRDATDDVLPVEDGSGFQEGDRVEVLGADGVVRARTSVLRVSGRTIAVDAKVAAPKGSVVRGNRWVARP